MRNDEIEALFKKHVGGRDSLCEAHGKDIAVIKEKQEDGYEFMVALDKKVDRLIIERKIVTGVIGFLGVVLGLLADIFFRKG